MENIKILAPSKVNLCLFVLFKRNDGYHEIESVMQTINIFDEISIEKTSSGVELVVEPSLDIPPEENLAFKAAMNFFEATAIEGGAFIKLKKGIPSGSGLGGGSSDAASVLLLLNRAYGSPLTMTELAKLGEILGSDVPFFLVQGTALVKGRGEKVYPIPFNLTFHLTVVMPPSSLSTRIVYENFVPPNSLEKNTLQVLRALRERDLRLLASSLRNDLEKVALRFIPEIQTIKDLLIQAGALGAVVSGSGSSVFGIFSDSKQAEKAANFFQSHGFWARHAWSTPPLR